MALDGELDYEMSEELSTITSQINEYKKSERNSVFEIGKRLRYVKENVLKHGQFTKWADEQLGYKLRTAQKYMQVEKRFGNTIHPESTIPVSRLWELVTLPHDVDLNKFITEMHQLPSGEKKTLSQMNRSEIRALVSKFKQPNSKSTHATFLDNDVELELKRLILDHVDYKLSELNDTQRKELLNCCTDNTYFEDLLIILRLVEKKLDHDQIRYLLKLRTKITKAQENSGSSYVSVELKNMLYEINEFLSTGVEQDKDYSSFFVNLRGMTKRLKELKGNISQKI